MQTTERLNPPQTPGEWPLSQIQTALSRPLPESMLEAKTLKGSRISYISWHTVNRVLDKYAPGWTWEICQMGMSADRLFLVGRLTIPTADGSLYREATGTEELKRTNDNGTSVELAYGDPSSNAESMAFRRAAAKFGLGLYLYDKG